MVVVRNPEIRKAVDTLYELSGDEKVRREYEMHMKAVRDRACLRNDGYQEGLEEGVQKGIQQGVQQGILEVASRMKSMGLSPEHIIDLLGN